MKKALLLFASALLLLVGCQKEKFDSSSDNGETIEVSFTAMLEKAEATRAVADNDGNAAKVNHWVLQVYEVGENGALFYKEERDVAAGTLTQTYKLKLFKNQTYNLLFWADNKHAYNTADLREVSVAGSVANIDARDAFSARVKDYKSEVSESKTIPLTRPFAQLNIITCDLYDLKTKVVPESYGKYAPSSLKVVATVPTTFNVQTQQAGEASEQTLTAAASYADFSTGAPETTLFMDYIFASEEYADVLPIDFSFTSNGQTVAYNFTDIPLQRNYRTNIKGNLMSNDSNWTVTIDNEWNTPEYFEELWAAGMITPVTPVEDVYTINRPSELAWIAQQVNADNTFEGKTVKLAKDIDLNNGEWTPIGGVPGYPGTAFMGTLDGNSHKILNLNCSDKTKDYASAALIGAGKNCTIKNLTLENVKVSSTHYAAAIVGYVAEGIATIENCIVKNGSITSTPEWLGTGYNNGDKVGGILGYGANACKISGCTVEGLTIKAYRDLGGIAGAAKCADIKDNSVKDCTVTADQTVNSYGKQDYNAGAIVGRPLEGIVDESNTAENVTISPYTIDASGNYHVATKSGMFVLAAEINSNLDPFYGKTIFLEKDIDLEHDAWTPIQGSQSADYAITFNGQNHKISNVAISDIPEDGGSGFFGHWAGTITNLTLDGVSIENTINWSGALCGYFSTGTISNVNVSNVAITNLNEEKCKRNGGLCGFVDTSTDFSNVALCGVAITGTEQLGGFIGSLQDDGTATYNFTNCSISDVSIYKVGTKSVTSFGTKTGGHAPTATINGDIAVSGTNTLPEGSPENGWGANSL